MFKRFWKATNGATAIEYGLIAALIAVAAIAAWNSLNTKLHNTSTIGPETRSTGN
ncbi:MAG: Flp family type IVb pilin [Patescibacteria group bacterium]